MTNLRKIAMAVAIIAVFTTFVGCGKTQQEAVEATTEQVADDTQEQAVEATTQEQVAEAATEQAVEADTAQQAEQADTAQQAETTIKPEEGKVIVVWRGEKYVIEKRDNLYYITPPNGEEVPYHIDEEPLEEGKVYDFYDIPHIWQSAVGTSRQP